jgi:hypothetical protein
MLQLLLETPEFEDFEAAIEDLEVQTSLHFHPYFIVTYPPELNV